MDYKIKKQDWERIYNTMTQYNRENGFLNILDNKLTFFDNNATIDGVNSFYITKSEVKNYLSNFNK